MAVYGESPFAKFASGDSFENPKHTTPIAAYAASPPIAWRPSVPSALLGQSDEHHRRKANLSALLVLVLLACAFSAAYVMRPHQAEGTGNSRHPLTQPQLQSATLQRRYAGKDTTVHCKVLHSRNGQHTVDATLCTQQSDAGAPQHIAIWHHTYKHNLGTVGSSSSSAHQLPLYTYSMRGSDLGHKRMTHRKALHLVQQ